METSAVRRVPAGMERARTGVDLNATSIQRTATNGLDLTLFDESVEIRQLCEEQAVRQNPAIWHGFVNLGLEPAHDVAAAAQLPEQI